MKKLGQFQNDVSSLEELEILNYERIFKIYQKTNNDKNFYFYNILKKIELPTDISSDILQHYYVESRTALPLLSYRIYNDLKSWWILFLLNKEKIVDLFWVNGGTQLKYLTEAGRLLVHNELTKQIELYGRHY